MSEQAILVSYDVTKPGALEGQLLKYCEQRFQAANTRVWAKRKWAKLSPYARAKDVTIAIGQGKCTFTLPVRPEDAAPLREMLEAKKVKNLEIRPATPEDIERNRALELEMAAHASPVVHTPVKGAPLSNTPWAVDVILPRSTAVGSDHAIDTHNLVVWGDELIGSWWHAQGGPQIHVIRGSFEAGGILERTCIDVAYPQCLLMGVCFDKEGQLWAGGGSTIGEVEQCSVYHSSDHGRSWKAEPVPEGLRGPGIQALVWFEDALFVMNEHGVMRRSGTSWEAVQVPTELHPKSHRSQQFVTAGGHLYFLGKGIGRWNGAGFVTELLLEESWSSVNSLACSPHGTLLAGSIVSKSPLDPSAVVWRKPVGGAWQRIPQEALGPVAPNKPQECSSYANVLVVGQCIVLLDSAHKPHVQRHLVRVSEDDGLTFRVIDIPDTDGDITIASAAVDPGGGVTIAGFGGLLLRLGLPSA